MSGEVRIRFGAPDDLGAVHAIERASFGDPWPPAALAQELEPSDFRLPLVVELDGRVAGYLMAWATPDELHILNIAVEPRLRRRHLGARLLLAAIDAAREAGLGAITLEVRPGNEAALAMYRRHGFVRRGVRPRYYTDTGEDAIVLTLDLRRDGEVRPAADR